jgi:lipopolysaccharide/colanic/teichoic acid biosynthesis glycosyltransferase
VPKAATILFLIDAVMIGVCAGLGILARLAFSPWYLIGFSGATVTVLISISCILLPLGFLLGGLYPGYGLGAVERLRIRVKATVFAFSAVILFDYLAHGGVWSRGALLAAMSATLILGPIWDSVVRGWAQGRSWWGERAILVGPVERRREIRQAVEGTPDLGWIVVEEGEWEALMVPPPPGIDLALAPFPPPPSLSLDDAKYARMVLVPESPAGRISCLAARDIGTHVGFEARRNLLVPMNRGMKRLMDVGVGTLAMVLALPVIAVAAVAIMAISPGTPFFCQTREGLEGKPFSMWKLRTMVPDAEARLKDILERSSEDQQSWQRSMKLEKDTRVLPGIGGFLRRTSVDELPQLWNVLRGDMSLVGPRPLPAYHIAALDGESADLRRRTRPGMTGLWQVSGRSAVDMAEQERLDSYYARAWSLWLDLHILGRTVAAVLSGRGAY